MNPFERDMHRASGNDVDRSDPERQVQIPRISFTSGEDGFDLAAIEAIRSIDDLNSVLSQVARSFGFKDYCIYEDLRADTRRVQPLRIVTSLPDRFHSGLDAIISGSSDDFLEKAWHGNQPAFWSLQTVRAKPDRTLAAALLDHFAEFGINCGINIPQADRVGRLRVLSLTGYRDFLEVEEIEALNFTAILLLQRFAELEAVMDARGQDAVNLMELKFLEAYANGFEADLLAKKFSLSVPTVSFILESARRKLGTDTLPHAVAEAIRRGIID